MLRVKFGVKLKGLQNCMLMIIDELSVYFEMELHKDCVITSATEGKHGRNSLHYVGKAVDIRIYHLTKDEIKKVISFLKKNYDADYDIVLESNHIHIEYDPHYVLTI